MIPSFTASIFNLLTFFLIVVPFILDAQNVPGTSFHIKKASGIITLDGVLDEPDWKEAQIAKDFFLNYPVDTARAPFQTEVRMTFDEHMLYFSFVATDDTSPDLINSLRRDFEYERNDNVGISIGPYNDRINGFYFILTPKGIQGEGTIAGGGATDDQWASYWDNKWYSKVVRYADKWIAEIAIPFKSFRYKSDVSEWNIAFDRLDKKRNHKSSWIRTPIQYIASSFAYSGQLVWDDPIPPPHPNITFIPFVAGGTSTDNTSNPQTRSHDLQVGFDAKIGVTPSLNLDLTVNPDFSQVEVDQQVVNLTRFEFKFPERRQFFLENSDLFDKAGSQEARTFFSRRIGLVADKNGLYTRIPIAYGARLSGSLTSRWRINAMNMQTKETLSLGLPAQNFTVATIQRNFWKQSSFSVTYVDKESLGVDRGDSARYFHESVFRPAFQNGKTQLLPNTWNRVIDADLELLSPDNRWYSSSFISRSFDAFNVTDNVSGGFSSQYAARNLIAVVGSSYVGKNYNAEAGYVPSHGVYPGQVNYNASVTYKIYPGNAILVWMAPQFTALQTYLPDGTLTDKNYSIGYSFNFISTAQLQFSGNYVFQKLTNDFNPLEDTKYTSFLIGERYEWKTISGTFQSNTRKIANFILKSTYGGFYNGSNLNVNGQFNVRRQPYGNVSLQFDYNDLRLAANYGSAKLLLVGPRFDITFTDRIFITSYVQYNKLLDNMNLNVRFQWRYKPASDFFIAYTENYLPENLFSKNRALVFKLTYWLNL